MTLPRFTNFATDPVTLARRLLGQRLVRVLDGNRLAGTIVEVEAYLGANDACAHTFGGRRSPRNESMYLSAGHLYVYFTYGMHHCMNIVAGKADEGVAVLLRAIEPTEGIDMMQKHRGRVVRDRDLTSGPGKICQAFAIDRHQHDGLNLMTESAVYIEQLRSRSLPKSRIVQTPRIGVGEKSEWAYRPLRFFVKDNAHVSRGRYAQRPS